MSLFPKGLRVKGEGYRKSPSATPYTLHSTPRAKGFTLVELVVSIAIFGFMTALLVAKYGNFNQSVLLTDLAYDAALLLRTAQTYGLSVKGAGDSGISCASSSSCFQYPYGIHVSTVSTDPAENRTIILFADNSPINAPDHVYTSGSDTPINTYAITRGAIVSNVCTTSGSCAGTGRLDVTFKRPDPNAIICLDGACGSTFAQIVLKGTDGSIRTLTVQQNGQISVLQ